MKTTIYAQNLLFFKKSTKILLSDEKSLNLGNMQGGAI
jgi:hypothetical protein